MRKFLSIKWYPLVDLIKIVSVFHSQSWFIPEPTKYELVHLSNNYIIEICEILFGKNQI